MSTKVGDRILQWYMVHPLLVSRPPAGSVIRQQVCPTCDQTVSCVVLGVAETRKRRRIRAALALAAAVTTVVLVGLTVVNFDPDRNFGVTVPLAFGAMRTLVAAAFLCDSWLAEDGVWLRNPETGRRYGRLGPVQDPSHGLTYK
ncbi:hypothetical protein ACIPH4_13970 [Streptomyces tendae]|uniref:hypothetical protein n=1 Tax=Streptomyces tendae TaxID=1932 RepID=UPI0038074CE6